MRKRLFLVALMVVVFALAIGGSAWAVKGNSTYTLWSEAATANGGVVSPHGDYASATKNCGVCHAVHNAPMSGQVLLAQPIANACTYCHITSTVGVMQVYGGYSWAYTSDAGTTGISNHSNAVTGANGGSGCSACHATHGANTAFPSVTTTDTFDLRLDVAASWTATYTSKPSSTTINTTEIDKWCSGCHPYWNQTHNGTTHIIATYTPGAYNNTATAGMNSQVAWVGDPNCQACHDSKTGSFVLNGATYLGFPHYTPGTPRFLSKGVVNGSGNAVNNDGVCLACHSDGGTGAAGVGTSF